MEKMRGLEKFCCWPRGCDPSIHIAALVLHRGPYPKKTFKDRSMNSMIPRKENFKVMPGSVRKRSHPWKQGMTHQKP